MTANSRQVGGDHYNRHGGEQHWDRVHRLGLDYFQAQITKYVERAWNKNGMQDLQKALHVLEKYIELSQGREPVLACVTVSVNVQGMEEVEAMLKEAEAAVAHALLQRDTLLANRIVTQSGKVQIGDLVFECLRGNETDFVREGLYGDDRVLWTCRHCRSKINTRGDQLPHAVHGMPCDANGSAATPAYVGQDSRAP